MSSDKKKIKFRHSIRVQLACIFIAALVLVVISSFVINRFFLQDFYVRNKSQRLERIYQQIDLLANTFESGSEEFSEACAYLVNDNNISAVVVNSSFDIRYSSENRSEILISRLVWHILSNDEQKAPSREAPMGGGTDKIPGQPEKKTGRDEKILRQTDVYAMSIANDPMVSSRYIELWGILENGDLVFLRTPLESIRENASIANTFLLYIMAGTAAIGILVIWILSKKITDPVLRLTEVADRMAHLDFEARFDAKGRNEIDELGLHINELSVKLKEALSDLRTANNELKKDIEKKEEIENMRMEFVSNVSHELKTPIALIQGYAEGLKDNISSDEESRNFYCDVIMDEADKMNRMVKNLLTLNRLEFGNEEVKLERFDLTELIRSCMTSSDIMLKQFGVSASFENKDPLYVWGDEFMAEEVFQNLFSNAVRYCGGEKRIEVSIKESGDKARVNVFNTGQPIPEEDIDHIWEKFYKVDKARSREVGGTGIGLSIVRAVMESLNNSCGVINYDNGVAFYFELDRA
ncbi:MAG: cell wall metabolism sensor histidine kinase WalK [Lachnospiraceae bacterium]|nr:cell wall metabolism sensor histidine kinase WalK [Lachnospiraceae bacterium]